MNLASLKGRSLPSAKYGAWIVDEVSQTIDGRSRLVTGNLKGEQWVWTWDLVNMFEEMDEKLCLQETMKENEPSDVMKL